MVHTVMINPRVKKSAAAFVFALLFKSGTQLHKYPKLTSPAQAVSYFYRILLLTLKSSLSF
jgi:hypothetical protein